MTADQAFEKAAASLEATAADFYQMGEQLTKSYPVNAPRKVIVNIRILEEKAKLLRGQALIIRQMKTGS